MKNYNVDTNLPEGLYMEKIVCVGCGWSWKTSESDSSDMYVCHQCGFDNTLYYDSGFLKPAPSVEQIIEKYGKTEEEVLAVLKDGAKHEMEHTDNKQVAKMIASHHIWERFDYYDLLERIGLDGEIISENNNKSFDTREFLDAEKKELELLLSCDETKIYKALIIKSKIDLCEMMEKKALTAESKTLWYVLCGVWKEGMQNLQENNFKIMKDGGECPCKKMYSKGGLAYGNSHDKGGIPAVVQSTGQQIEYEGGEGVVNKRSMAMKKKLQFEGKRLTPCEIISKINQMGGGVKFKCDDVEEIIAADGHF